jgi:release factor glutamine methyltransferase
MPLSIRDALTEATKELNHRGIETARLDSEVLLAYLLGLSRTDLYLRIDEKLSPEKVGEFDTVVRRRADFEPVAYITGEKEFMSLLFQVNRNVLIPRPETEVLIQEALAIRPLNIIDVGTGSGAIAVSLVFYLPDSYAVAIDISSEAIKTAHLNAVRHCVDKRISFMQADLLELLRKEGYQGRTDLITANLPYIPANEMDNLPPEVLGHEPAIALNGGPDGLDYYRQMIPDAYNLLKPDGVLLSEIGYNQAELMKDILVKAGFKDIRVINDLAGLNRIMRAVK